MSVMLLRLLLFIIGVGLVFPKRDEITHKISVFRLIGVLSLIGFMISLAIDIWTVHMKYSEWHGWGPHPWYEYWDFQASVWTLVVFVSTVLVSSLISYYLLRMRTDTPKSHFQESITAGRTGILIAFIAGPAGALAAGMGTFTIDSFAFLGAIWELLVWGAAFGFLPGFLVALFLKPQNIANKIGAATASFSMAFVVVRYLEIIGYI